jgi:hypothetical protein
MWAAVTCLSVFAQSLPTSPQRDLKVDLLVETPRNRLASNGYSTRRSVRRRFMRSRALREMINVAICNSDSSRLFGDYGDGRDCQSLAVRPTPITDLEALADRARGQRRQSRA